MLLDALLILIGLLVLIRAGHEFVAGAARIAIRYRLRPAVVGAVIVGFGTSVPELIVAGVASAQHSTQIAVGSLVGSNIANVSVILSVAALIRPVRVDSRTVRREAPLSVAAVILFAALLIGGLSRVDGAILLAALAIAVTLLLSSARRGPADDQLARETVDFFARSDRAPWIDPLRAAIALIVMLAGAEIMIRGAEMLAGRLGLSLGLVGLTIVALGTSAPELVSAVQASRQGDPDLVVGNLLGSNLFNSLAGGAVIAFTLGGSRAGTPMELLPVCVMVGVCLASWATMWRGGVVNRWEAAGLLAVYAAMIPLIAR